MKIKSILVLLLLSLNLNAHTLIMDIIDNEDNTITVVGAFSTGEKTVGALVKLESLITGEVLYQKRLPKESELTIEIPKEQYQVVLDGGPGHTVVKEGFAPLEGFTKKTDKTQTSKKLSQNQHGALINTSVIVLFSIAFVLLVLTLYFSAKNTKMLTSQLKK
ncbi:hypothetical protein [Halarcobacter bivalviorum]|uniref:Membrane protein n=1 Tax=Halarcobacter bivalviorum TaxID=663364 RepID=A0AB33GI25_9BACT|nr:hypothetical protein [Halarcobacter bivalviorum]AXH13120.1 putative membrane protein [Halarcobacter bivalviorum]